MKLSERTKTFVTTYIDLIEDENYSLLYETAQRSLGEQGGLLGDASRVWELTSMLLTAGIDPLDFLNYVPACYMYQCPINASLIIPSHICEIQAAAFASNNNLTRVQLPSQLEKIDQGAFSSCYKLEEITIPRSVKVIGDGAFGNCCRLNNIFYEGTMAEWDNIKQKRSSWGHETSRQSTLKTPAKTVACLDGVRTLTKQRSTTKTT